MSGMSAHRGHYKELRFHLIPKGRGSRIWADPFKGQHGLSLAVCPWERPLASGSFVFLVRVATRMPVPPDCTGRCLRTADSVPGMSEAHGAGTVAAAGVFPGLRHTFSPRSF